MSAPPAPAYTGPAFLFEGDTFAVPSWEFRCTLPPVYGLKGITPTVPLTLFGATWQVARTYIQRTRRPNGALLLLADGRGLFLNIDGLSAHVHVTDPMGGTAVPFVGEMRLRSPDEFMHALKAIAERNGE